MKRFKTKDEALKHIEEKRKLYDQNGQKFCPLINMDCKESCVCFNVPIYKYDEAYGVTPHTAHNDWFGCGNAMFTETEIVNNI